jgi:hypothetical protein
MTMSTLRGQDPYREPGMNGVNTSRQEPSHRSRLKPRHYFFFEFTAVTILVYALPAAFQHDHPWRFLLVLVAMTLDNVIGYHHGWNKQQNALIAITERIETPVAPPRATSDYAQAWNEGYEAAMKDALEVIKEETRRR